MSKILNRNLKILNITVSQIKKKFIEFDINFKNPGDVSIGGDQF